MRATVASAVLLAGFLWVSCTASQDDLVIYSGRSQALIEPLIDRFEEETGLSVGVRYGDTAQLAIALSEEGDRTSADLFWAQDAGALGAVHADGLLTELPDSIVRAVPEMYRSTAGTWVATSGRARTLVYSSSRVDSSELPASIFELTDERFRGRVGWAPINGSFQANLTAMRRVVGEDETRAWLRAMKQNGAKVYPRNTAIVQAVAGGDIDFGLANHYYLHRFKSEDPGYPVEQTFFREGDPGNLINVAGVGVLAASDRQETAFRFVQFLLSPEIQEYVTNTAFEYPVRSDIQTNNDAVNPGGLHALQPELDLDELRDLEETLAMLRAEGLL